MELVSERVKQLAQNALSRLPSPIMAQALSNVNLPDLFMSGRLQEKN